MATSSRSRTSIGEEVIGLSADDNSGIKKHNLPLLCLPRTNNSSLAPAPHREASPHHNGLPPLAQDMVAQDMAERDDYRRPVKRQRTSEPSLEATHEQRRRDVAAALGQCLENQVFPHIERATTKLSPAVYDLDRLGAKVIRLIVDKEFERHFHQGNGRLLSSVELSIAAGVHRLVTELSSGPEYRRPTQNNPSPAPLDTTAAAGARARARASANTITSANAIASTSAATAPVAVPAVLPSIENDVDDDDDDDDDDNSGHPDSDARGNGQLDAESEHQSDIEEPERAVTQSRIRTPPRRRPPQRLQKRKELASPQQLRTRAKAGQWQSGKPYASASQTKQLRSFGLPIRPYISALERQHIISGVARAFLPLGSGECPLPQVFHVDLSDSEIDYLQSLARALYGKPVVYGERSALRDLRNVLKKVPDIRARLAEIHSKGYGGYEPPPPALLKRSSIDVTNFLNDLYNKKLDPIPKSLFIEYDNSVAQSEANRANQISTLLLSREIAGNRLGAARTYHNFKTIVRSNREDYLEPQIEWTNCAGDIMTVSWLSNTDFICGTTTHSDSHNQQYNKPGNLLLGSAATNTLRAYPDHRIIRPIVSSGDNALDSMVASQDPWLFTSVVSSDYDPSCGLAFTSSFDRTVKVWKPRDGSMVALGTWGHDGRVNFVLTSKNGMSTVATAADVPTAAVRVYHLDQSNISGSRYDSYSCTRVHDEDYVPSEKWAYYPAAIRWGVAPDVNHLLLIGYSPRSPTGKEHEIPEDKRDTGELCLWDTITRAQVRVSSAKTQNVFEVAWHPSRASFAAATSASKALERTDELCRTQVRIFEMNHETGQYGAIKTLDCAAIDINELSIMPNCLLYSYIAASCTDGKVYVWDTAGSDLPMCVLEHGDPVEELLGEREEEDVGVKFTAWATTADRLYTGSSDGVVKVWNIRHGKGVLIKDLIEVAAPITYGAFSPDFTRLVVGDGSGRVYLLALEDPEDEDPLPKPAGVSAGFLNIKTSNGNQRAIRRPRPFLPHPELPPPGGNKLMEGQESAREYLHSAQLMLHPDPTVGAIQGANYAGTCLFRAEAHINENPNEPLLDTFQSKQQGRQRLNHQANLLRTPLPQQVHSINSTTIFNGWHHNSHAHQPTESTDSNDNERTSYNEDIFNHATWLELQKERAELDDRLIELDYETSILDSEEEEEDVENK
ncbi:WD40 repeat-like protein [Xylaria telfairii]|nr:WD40 repeat-like protein [Xylaria telfairii]